MGRAGYLRTQFKAVTAAELTRRRALRVALEASLAGAKGGRVLVTALRRHLAEFHGTGYAALAIVEIVRTCRGLAKWRGGGRRTVLIGVELRKPGARQLAARWEKKLAMAGVGLLRYPRPQVDVGASDDETDATVDTRSVRDPENKIHQPGLMVRSAGVWRQTVDHSIALLTADTRNQDGSRGRVRRHSGYYERLKKAAARARLTMRERQIVDVLVAGGTWRDVGKRLELGKSRVHEVVRDLHKKLAVKGPGAGR